jgi:site-specific DNA-methyltransferase (adenine-specific)
LKKEPKQAGQAPAMIVFCAFEQSQTVIKYGQKHGFVHSYPIYFIKNYSAQVLKANMKIVGATEMAIVLYRDKLPKFNNHGKMVFNCIDWERDTDTPKVHPTQKPVPLLKKLIDLFTDEGDVVIDPCCGSGTTLLAAQAMDRKSYGFEVDRNFFNDSINKLLGNYQPDMFQALKYEGKAV